MSDSSRLETASVMAAEYSAVISFFADMIAAVYAFAISSAISLKSALSTAVAAASSADILLLKRFSKPAIPSFKEAT